MPTPRQRKLVSKIPASTSSHAELIREAGYSPATARKPAQVLESKGVQGLLEKAEHIGLNDDLMLGRIKEAVEHRNLNLATDTIFRWLRIKFPEVKEFNNQVNIQNNIVNISDTDVKSGIVDWVKNHPEVHEELRSIIT